MNKVIKFLLTCMLFIISVESTTFASEENKEMDYIWNTKRDLLVLMLTYPECIKDIEKDEKGFVYLVMQNNNKVLYDDKKEKSHEQKFYNSDLQDTLEQIYPLDMINNVMEEGQDPGRIRCYSFLSNMYGNSKEAVQKNIINKSTYYGSMMFNKVNGAHITASTASSFKFPFISLTNSTASFIVLCIFQFPAIIGFLILLPPCASFYLFKLLII